MLSRCIIRCFILYEFCTANIFVTHSSISNAIYHRLSIKTIVAVNVSGITSSCLTFCFSGNVNCCAGFSGLCCYMKIYLECNVFCRITMLQME